MNTAEMKMIHDALKNTGKLQRISQQAVAARFDTAGGKLMLGIRLAISNLSFAYAWPKRIGQAQFDQVRELVSHLNANILQGAWEFSDAAGRLEFTSTVILPKTGKKTILAIRGYARQHRRMIETCITAIQGVADDGLPMECIKQRMRLDWCQPGLESLPARERVADTEWSQLCAAMSGSPDHDGEDTGRSPEGDIPF